MIRFMNLNAAFLALTIAVAFGNYHVKYEAERKAKELAAVEDQIADEQERQRLLEAEWSHLNEPQRLQALAARYLTLNPIKATQIADMKELEARLPIPAREADAAKDKSDLPVLPAALTGDVASLGTDR